MTEERIINCLKKELPYLKKTYHVKKMGIFGSYANGTQNELSDIDIYVEFEDFNIGFQFIDFAEYIEKISGKKIDIITPAGIQSIRIKKVAKEIEREIVYV